ncbi:unnamed protein product [Lactuca virosa]|uniref:TFIIS-type domain-containing protein n=1 Tax=Lactuca virosa TaxID=75947 RepID=A0AAU9LXD2_9ASTR|nr:unnamed protein product [Lactuca virosa]
MVKLFKIAVDAASTTIPSSPPLLFNLICNTLRYRALATKVCRYGILPNFQIEQKVKIKRKQRLVKKEIDPIITQDDMKNAPKTDQAHCPDCGHNKAAYIQFQTRSADEPMTINFTCEKCGKCWRED